LETKGDAKKNKFEFGIQVIDAAEVKKKHTMEQFLKSRTLKCRHKDEYQQEIGLMNILSKILSACM
jgi:hypothetical protein